MNSRDKASKSMENSEVKVVVGDITTREVDAIVNAANESLLGGAGIDGAVHDAAGPELREYCAKLGGCGTGEAKITPGFNLRAKHIIHTVGPRYGRNDGQDAKLLTDCYINSIKVAQEHGLRSIAFPAISTGIFGYPATEAAKVAVQAIAKGLRALPPDSIDLVELVTFSSHDHDIYQKALDDFKISESGD